MAIQSPENFELPEKYVYIKQKLDFINAGLIESDKKSFEESDIEELFMMKEYLVAEKKVEELKNNGRRNYSKNHT